MIQTNQKTILVVDDEAEFRQILAFSLKRKGYLVLQAENGSEAYEVLKANPVDVLISDIRMPKGDGVELLDKIKADHLKTPVILLVTGYSELSSGDALTKGADAMFGKPFDRNILESTIQKILDPLLEQLNLKPALVEAKVRVDLKFSRSSEHVTCEKISFGRSGMFVPLTNMVIPDISDEVQFTLTIDGVSSRGLGIVRWVRLKDTDNLPAGAGIEFTQLNDQARASIELLTKSVT